MGNQTEINMKKEVRVGTSIILINEKFQVLIGKRKGSHGEGMYALPGGHLEFGETFDEGCSRELLEEVGVSFSGEYRKVGFSEDNFIKNGETAQYTTLYFVVDGVNNNTVIKNMEPDKCEEWKWYYAHNIPENMFCDSYEQIINLFQ